MLLSHKYKFIFIKTKKVAGTSVEIALSKYLGEKDIITPNSELTLFGNIRRFEKETEDDIRKNFNGVLPRNYKGNLYEETKSLVFRQILPYIKLYISNSIKKLIGKEHLKYIKLKRRFKFGDHMTAHEIKTSINKNIYETYTKFTIVRNPYDQAISDYYDQKYRPEHEKLLNFDHYLTVRSEIFFRKNYEKFVSDKKIQVDEVLRYENLEGDLLSFCMKKNIPKGVIDDFKKINTHTGLNKKKIKINQYQKKIIQKHAEFFFENFYQGLK